MHDSIAYSRTTLPNMIESLPSGAFVVCDNAYVPTEHLIPVYGGQDRLLDDHDDTNFYISQSRIHVERAFGIMKKRFSILQKPLNVSMTHTPHLLMAIARMHNWCLGNATRRGETELFDELSVEENPPIHSIDTTENAPPASVTPGISAMRQAIHNRVKEAGLKRPSQTG